MEYPSITIIIVVVIVIPEYHHTIVRTFNAQCRGNSHGL